MEFAPGALFFFLLLTNLYISASYKITLVEAMNKLFLLAVLLLAAPAFAANLTITGENLAPSFANTRGSVDMLNLSFGVAGDAGSVNITSINVTIVTAVVANVSAVQVKNATGTVIGANSSNSTATSFMVSFPAGINATNSSSVVISINISSIATRQAQVAVNITNASIATQASSNVTFGNANSNQSNPAQVQDVHANATISPRFVDTGVENQTFSYLFNITGLDSATNFSINLPSGYTLINLTSVERGGSPPANLTPGSDYTNTTLSNQVNVSLVSVTTQYVRIYFMANTSTGRVPSAAFTSNITGSNVTAATDAVLGNLTNATTDSVMNLTTVTISKGTAIINGTAAGVGSDYWEFNLTLNFNATVSGTLHFKMTNWTEQNNNTISYSACSGSGASSCATLRADINASLNTSRINITNNYDPAYGISMNPSAGNLTTLYLRMIIPSGTVVSRTWSAAYFALFRSNP